MKIFLFKYICFLQINMLFCIYLYLGLLYEEFSSREPQWARWVYTRILLSSYLKLYMIIITNLQQKVEKIEKQKNV